MKKSLFIAAAATLALCFTACKKDDDTGRRLTQFTAGMERVTSQQDAKIYLDDNLIKWEADDYVVVYSTTTNSYDYYSATPNEDDPTWATFTPYDGRLFQGPYVATYPMDENYYYEDRTLKIFNEQDGVDLGLDYYFPMYSESADGETFQFKNMCGVLKIHLQQENVAVSRIVITADQYITGYFVVDATDGIPSMSPDENWPEFLGNTITATCSVPQSIGGSGHDFYIFLPPSSATGYNLQMTLYQLDGSRCTKSCDGVVVERSKYTNITTNTLTFEAPTITEGALSGLFSCSPTGGMLAFAPGNLVATTTGDEPGEDNTTWSFHQHQYDMLGEANDVNGTCDLLGWSTASTYYGLSESTFGSDYGGVFLDWGTAMSEGWYTPTYDDWNYIFHTRYNHDKLYSFGSIEVSTDNYVNGYILLPDDWTLPTGCSFVPLSDDDDYLINTYTLTQWAAMEANGAVFLPLAGYREGGGCYDMHASGYYWAYSSSAPYDIVLNPTYLYLYYGESKYFGLSVRLATSARYNDDSPTKAISAKQGSRPVVGNKPVPQRATQKAGRPSHNAPHQSQTGSRGKAAPGGK